MAKGSIGTARARALATPIVTKTKTKTKTNPVRTLSLAAPPAVKPKLVAPPGGFHGLTLRQKKIIDAISRVKMGSTIKELSYRTNYYPTEINNVLYFTQAGRILAETGRVSITQFGARPRWYKNLVNKHLVKVRLNSTQKISNLPAIAGGDTETVKIARLVQATLFDRTPSPRRIKEAVEQINNLVADASKRQIEATRELDMLNDQIAKINTLTDSFIRERATSARTLLAVTKG